MTHDTSPDPDIVQKLLTVMSGLVPMLDTVKQSIEESTGSIPPASRQLNSVTSATETATVEILNVLDTMAQKMATAEAGLAALKEHRERRRRTEDRLTDQLRKIEQNTPPSPDVSALMRLWNEHQSDLSGSDPFAMIETSLRETKTDSMNIAMALQVQDITSQQIASVVHTIESVREKLLQVLNTVNGTGTTVAGAAAQAQPSHFDKEAQFTRSTDRQDTADQIVQQFHQ